MGLYDRDYLREDDYAPGVFPGGPRSMTTNLIIVNVAVFLVDYLFSHDDPLFGERVGPLTEWCALQGNLLSHPWNVWQLLTYGFLHDLNNIRHILFNMIGLYFFGREVEAIYGRREYLLLYMLLLVGSGLVWLVGERTFAHTGLPLIGASGAVMGMTMMFVLHYPHRMILIFGILPMPAWVAGTLFIVMDLAGALGVGQGGNVAYLAHLGGVGLAFLYWRSKWRLSSWIPDRMPRLRLRRPSLRVHRPVDEHSQQQRVDELLAKISSQGEASLTREERRVLEEASRRYQKRRQQ